MSSERPFRLLNGTPAAPVPGDARPIGRARERGELMYITHDNRYRLEFAGQTDPGQVRQTNEDGFLALPECGLFAVADGVGGRNRGELASATALEVLAQRFKAAALGEDRLADLLPGKASELLVESVFAAHREIVKRASAEPGCTGMSTTIMSAFFSRTRVHIAHAGDSRCYLMENGNLRQLTTDHTVIEELKRLMPYTPELASKLAPLNIVAACSREIQRSTGEIGGITPYLGR